MNFSLKSTPLLPDLILNIIIFALTDEISEDCLIRIQGDPLQTVELLHHKKIFNNGQKKSPLLHIDQNMTPFIILEKKFFVPFKKVEFLFAFVAKQSFVEQNGAHFWHISSKTS